MDHQGRAAGESADPECFSLQIRAGLDFRARVDVVGNLFHVGGDDFDFRALFDGADHIVGVDATDGHGFAQHGAHDIGRAANNDRFHVNAVFLEHLFLLGDVKRPARRGVAALREAHFQHARVRRVERGGDRHDEKRRPGERG